MSGGAPLILAPRTGPQAGERLSFSEGPVAFGRAPDNTVVLEGDHVSRYHGVFRGSDAGWVLENRSANGTTLNRTEIGEEGAWARPGQVVGVGRTPLLDLCASDGQDAPEAAGPSDHASARKQRYKRYAFMLGGYFLLLVGVAVFLMTLKTPGDKTLGPKEPLAKERIREVIQRPVDRAGDPSEAERESALEKARQLYERPESQRDALYHAYTAYRRALAHTEAGVLENGLDQQRFHDLEQRLVDEFHERYREAYRHLRLQRYEKAERAFHDLLKFYPDENSPLHDHLTHQLKAVNQLRKKAREREREGF